MAIFLALIGMFESVKSDQQNQKKMMAFLALLGIFDPMKSNQQNQKKMIKSLSESRQRWRLLVFWHCGFLLAITLLAVNAMVQFG
jgi:hypothetical protein